MPMSLASMITVLGDCIRTESRDHAFGDTEVFWFKDGQPVAEGYFSGDHQSVWSSPNPGIHFDGDDAKQLRNCGVLGEVGRNDSSGPSNFVEGAVMPGLTREAVRSELCDWGSENL